MTKKSLEQKYKEACLEADRERAEAFKYILISDDKFSIEEKNLKTPSLSACLYLPTQRSLELSEDIKAMHGIDVE